MKKQLALVLARDVETSMKILAIAIEEENAYLIVEALTNAENELAGIRKLLLENKTVRRPAAREAIDGSKSHKTLPADLAKKMGDEHNRQGHTPQE